MSKKITTDPRAVRAYATLNAKSRDAVVKYVTATAADLSAGKITVSVLRASMKAAGKAGDLPVRDSHAQWFPLMARLLSSDTVEGVAVKRVATTCTNLGYAYGVDRATGTVLAFLSGALTIGSCLSDDEITNDDATPVATFDDLEMIAKEMKRDKAAQSKAGDKYAEGEGEGAGVTIKATEGATGDDIIRATVEALRSLDDITLTDVGALTTLAALIKAGRKAATVAA